MRGNRLVNICFHGIGTPGRDLEVGEAPYWVSIPRFREVMSYLAERPEVAVSFDDGNTSDVELALPVLRAHRMRASFFPIASRLDKPGSVDGGHLRLLTREGMTVGSHGMNHRGWRRLSQADAEIELVQARRAIEDACGSAVSSAACPLGQYDRSSLARLRQLGYTQVFTSDRSASRSSHWLQPRYSVTAHDTAASVRALVEGGPPVAQRLLRRGRRALKAWVL